MAEKLAASGHDVAAMVRKPQDVQRLLAQWRDHKGLRPVLADVTDPASLEGVFHDVEAFIHAAAAVGENQGDDSEFYAVNVAGTGHVWRAAAKAGVRAGVLISSVAVYGRPDVPEVAESAPPARLEVAYERTKAAAESVALKLGALLQVHTSVLRPSLIWGPHDEQFIPRILRGLRSRSFVFVGDPDRPINVCSSAHLTQCAVSALHEKAANGEAFNVVDAMLPTWRQAVTLMAQEAHLPVPSRSLGRNAALNLGTALDVLRSLHVPGLPPALNRFTARVAGGTCVYRIDKAQRVLGYRPTEEFLRDAAPFIREAAART
jgi:nucleoside-diphosphate-sugar epimerase